MVSTTVCIWLGVLTSNLLKVYLISLFRFWFAYLADKNGQNQLYHLNKRKAILKSDSLSTVWLAGAAATFDDFSAESCALLSEIHEKAGKTPGYL